jgi:DNA-binding winged helix-turn-helix (wHTH) protein/cytochrome c-type biogenesis protein CcmH/NrfG/predicted negative regulator of RcsB-dependent stress response
MLPITRELYRFDSFELDPSKRLLRRDEEPVWLAPKAFDVLAYLVMNPGRVVTKDELLKAVWPDSFVEEGNLAQYISALRKAMGNKSSLIVTVPGRGYQFAAQVRSTELQNGIADSVLSEQEPGDIVVQRVRERTRVIYEDVPAARLPAPAPTLLLAAGTSRSEKIWRWVAVSALGALIALAAFYGWRHFASPPPLSDLVLADFTNDTGDAAFDHSLGRALEIDLGQSPFLNLLTHSKIRETLALMQRKGDETLTPELAGEVCERNNAQAVLEGAIAMLGSKYMVTLAAESCVSGKRVAGYKAVANSKDEVLRALDEAAGRVRRQLGESAASLEHFQTPIEQATTSSLEALRAYSQAWESYDRGDITAGQTLFEKAIALDPNFASAYRGLSRSYFDRQDVVQAASLIQKAYDLRAPTTERERLNIEIAYNTYGTWDVEAAIDSLHLFNQIYPNDASSWFSLCNLYSELGEYPQAIEAGEHAYRLAPHSGTGAEILARAYRRANRFTDAKRVAIAAIANDKELWGVHITLFQIAFAEQDAAGMKTEAEWGITHQQLNQTLAILGFIAASQGKLHEAIDDFSRARQLAIRNGDLDFADHASLWLAPILFEYGDTGGAAASLKQMKGDGGDPGTKAYFQAEVGNLEPARRMIAKITNSGTKNTISLYFDLPMLRALLALKAHQPAEAVKEIEPARKYQMRDYGVPYQRARIEAEAGMLDQAAADYRLILANQGIGSIWPDYTLTHLRLARVLAEQKQPDEARRQYQTFFDAWKDADANLPLLLAARSEYARLQ